jgi:nucleotide-binding universal stress UspA family protein
MKILLAVDGSTHTKRMLGYLAAHDELFGTAPEYHVITVVSPLPSRVKRFIDDAARDHYYREEAQRIMKPVQAFAGQHKWKFKTIAASGNPGEVIAKTATSGKFDLLVMGSHGHSRIGNLLLGSVASRVIALCKTPVMIIR